MDPTVGEPGEPELLPLVLPGLYFGSLGVCFVAIFTNWGPFKAPRLDLDLALIAIASAGVALRVTWGLIFAFFREHLQGYCCDGSSLTSLFTCRSPQWLAASGGDTFLEAYVQVTDDAGGWVWSSMLLMWVVPGCLWLHVEATRLGFSRGRQLAFLVVGFLGAISVAFPLFFADVLARHRHRLGMKDGVASAEVSLGLTAVAPLVAALVCAFVLPHTVHRAPVVYTVALASLHFVLMIPSLFNGRAPTADNRAHARLALVYAAIAGATALQHGQNLTIYLTQSEVTPDFRQLLAAGWDGHCQSSISWDAVFTSFACIAFMVASRGWANALPFVVLSPFFTVAATFSAFLASNELRLLLELRHQPTETKDPTRRPT